ncbi:MAG TPA: IgGFc-binding protein, partial [Cytophagaceae bacterium]
MKQLFTILSNFSFIKPFLTIIIFNIVPAKAQIDTAFWLAVPQVGVHGNQNSELVFSNMDKTNAASVTISCPSSATPLLKTISIPVGGSVRVDMNQYYGRGLNAGETPGTLYNLEANQINNNGLYIKASTNITAFYELGRDIPGQKQGNNIEIFSLKGGNALGTDFMLPFQNQYETWDTFLSYSSANIVATENGTIITITPTRNAVGHPAGVPFNITLNRGQTYSLRAEGLNPQDHLTGSTISSNKPIAVTLVDDSLQTTGDNYGNGSGGIDMVGDQIVPLNVLGKEYIVSRGLAGDNNGDRNRIFILPTQASTNITISEVGFPDVVLTNQNAGQIINYLQRISPAAYIKSDKPLYVFYVSGSRSELGGALIPPIICTGSQSVNIVRSSDAPFSLIILTKTKNINDFTFKRGNTTVNLINPAVDFKVVTPGPEG